ncbi:hypothetical protein EK21DRAFT_85572 [Setomelanomma holmii]|uniref:Uncharacterized protein n=1 Tax=Setomelanomma holmii TaxID=210430 RepID=A0A9P4HGN6_9PLEO|nr:hypothetical protein EK21DRAFT_85572 [Setomelanomma holmii]
MRVLFMRHGHISDELFGEVCDQLEDLAVVGKSKTKWTDVKKQIQSDVYGASSFLRRYVYVEISAENCANDVERLDLAIRQINAEIQDHLDARASLTADTYRREKQEQLAKAKKAEKSQDRRRASVHARFCLNKAEDPKLLQPSQRVYVNTAGMIATRPVYLSDRGDGGSGPFWRPRITDPDVFVSIFGHVHTVAGVLVIRNDAKYNKLYARQHKI